MENIDNLIGKVHNVDCLEFMKELPDKSIGMVFTDPPYNEGFNYRGSEYNDSRNDYHSFIENVIIESKRTLKDNGSIYLKHSSRQINTIMPLMEKHFIFRNLIIWVSNSQAHPKDNYDSYYEPIYYYTKSDDYIFNKRAELRQKPPNYWSGEGKEFIGLLVNVWYDIKKVQAGCLAPDGGSENNMKLHPCSMPVRLAQRAINISSNENDIILDPFMGSGTTAKACIRMNRRFIGAEISKEYHGLAEEQINREKDQLKLEI